MSLAQFHHRSLSRAALFCATFGLAVGHSVSIAQAQESAEATPVAATEAAPEVKPATEIKETAVIKPKGGNNGGKYTLNALIQRALSRNPKLVEIKQKANVHKAEAEAAWDIKDPELRFAWGWGEDEIDAPYSDYRSGTAGTTRTDSSTSKTVDQNWTQYPGDVPVGSPELTTKQRESETSSRNTYFETERKVIPGKYEDKIVETTYEVEKDSSNNNRRSSDSTYANQKRNGSSKTNRKVVSRSESVRTHADASDPEDSFQIQLRFFLPNPWIAMGKKKEALAKLSLSEREALQEAWEIELAVRKAYSDAQFSHSLATYNKQILAHSNHYVAALEPARDFLLSVDARLLPNARQEEMKNMVEVNDSTRRLNEDLAKIAELTGIDSPEEVLLDNDIKLRQLSISTKDVEPLVKLALTSRTDLQLLDGKIGVANAELARLKAERIPFTTYIQGWYGETETTTGRGSEEWGIQLGVSLPLASLFFNKEHKIHEAEAAAASTAKTTTEELIRSQVSFAIRNLSAASKALAETNRMVAFHATVAKKNLEEAQIAAQNRDRRAIIIQHDTEVEGLKLERDKMQGIAHYNEAVHLLEAALGASIEEAFKRGQVGGK